MALPSFGSFFNTKMDSNDVKSHDRVQGFHVDDGDTSNPKFMPQFINKNSNQGKILKFYKIKIILIILYNKNSRRYISVNYYFMSINYFALNGKTDSLSSL